MKQPALPIQHVNGVPLSNEQRQYLTGYFEGISAQGFRFSDVEPMPQSEANSLEDLIPEERIKRERHPLDVYEKILENAATNRMPDPEEVFRFKWNGLFFLSPVQEAFMARLRIPGGVLRSSQIRELARVAMELTSGYVQITTRANLQIRLIQPKDAPEVLRRIQGAGLHTRGSGADNIRNITANPTAGVDPVELIDVLPFVNELSQIIINDRSFYDLPRKFNIAFDGGGLIGSVEDTNDIGVKAVEIGNTVWFRIAIGGATGHKSFARDLGVVVEPENINKVVTALVRIYIARGCRTDRKKARLKHLLQTMSLDDFLSEVEKLLGTSLRRSPLAETEMRWPSQELSHSHIGSFPQKQSGRNYVGVALPVGQITPEQMLRIAYISDRYGSGEIRLTVWQNFIIPGVATFDLSAVQRELKAIGLGISQSNLASGVIACTGNSYCKFAQSNTKAHALELSEYLDARIKLDKAINIHFTGCPNSCAQHYMGDIGCLGTKTKINGESVDAYHVFVGGGFGKNQAVGRQVYSALPASELPRTVECMLLAFLQHRNERETFQQFSMRHDLASLQTIFSGVRSEAHIAGQR